MKIVEVNSWYPATRSTEPINLEECIWSGKPNFILYFLIRRKILPTSIICLIIYLFFFHQLLFWGTYVFGGLYLVIVIQELYRTCGTRYYITNNGNIVVSLHNKNYCFKISELNATYIRPITFPIEFIFGYKSIRFCMAHNQIRYNKTLWRQIGWIHCISDHKKVYDLLK